MVHFNNLSSEDRGCTRHGDKHFTRIILLYPHFDEALRVGRSARVPKVSEMETQAAHVITDHMGNHT